MSFENISFECTPWYITVLIVGNIHLKNKYFWTQIWTILIIICNCLFQFLSLRQTFSMNWILLVLFLYLKCWVYINDELSCSILKHLKCWGPRDWTYKRQFPKYLEKIVLEILLFSLKQNCHWKQWEISLIKHYKSKALKEPAKLWCGWCCVIHGNHEGTLDIQHKP